MMLCRASAAPGLGRAIPRIGPPSAAAAPVRPRERTASREEAAIIFWRNVSVVSDSTVASHTIRSTRRRRPSPLRPPSAAPSCAAGRQHRHVADRLHRLDHLGHHHHGGNLAAMAAGLGALGHQNIDAGRDLAHRVPLAPTRLRPARRASCPSRSFLRRHAERVCDQADRMAEGDLSTPWRARVERCGWLSATFVVCAQRRISSAGPS